MITLFPADARAQIVAPVCVGGGGENVCPQPDQVVVEEIVVTASRTSLSNGMINWARNSGYTGNPAFPYAAYTFWPSALTPSQQQAINQCSALLKTFVYSAVTGGPLLAAGLKVVKLARGALGGSNSVIVKITETTVDRITGVIRATVKIEAGNAVGIYVSEILDIPEDICAFALDEFYP